MPRPQKLSAPSAALRNARRAWRLLHQDAPASLDLAQRALARSLQTADVPAQAWARLALGFHHLYFASPDEASEQLTRARGAFDDLSDRVGQLLACVGQARALWRSGRADEALALLLPLRDEGLRLLRHEQRGVLLNAIAGCYSAQGRSEEAFAYLFEALRGAGPARGHGFDAALHCNLSHELMELGDHDQALEQIQHGLARCEGLSNVRLESVLRINRVIVLTELGLADQALADVHRLSALSIGAAGRGTRSLHFETLAIAALRAGQVELGADLVARARALEPTLLSEERVELAMASALLAWRQGDAADALERLAVVSPLLAEPGGAHGVGLRIGAAVDMLASELHEAQGDSAAALAALRRWQAASARRSRRASGARYQAAALQTELLKLRHKLEENDVKRQATERARAEMALANRALSRKILEVEALQAALRDQARQDVLTGLYNRRHLNDTLPSQLALALRECQPLAVAVIDLDHFKAVNDQHGHAAGDALLSAFGQLLRDQLRASDQAFRFGGEEFCVLLPHTSAAAARGKIERLLAAWRRRVFNLDTGRIAGLSFSAGVTDTRLVDPTPLHLLRAADDLLLEAKRAGRTRVLVHALAQRSGLAQDSGHASLLSPPGR